MSILIKDLVDKTFDELLKIGYTESTIEHSLSTNLNCILDFYQSNNEQYFNEETNQLFKIHYLKLYDSKKISKATLNKRLRFIEIIREINEYGTYKWKVNIEKKNFDNNFSASIEDYLLTRDICEKGISAEKHLLYELSEFLIEQSISEPSGITSTQIIEFIKYKSSGSSKSMDKICTALSKYLLYLFNTGLLLSDISYCVKSNCRRDRKIQKIFPNEILSSLLNSIDTSTSAGKRDIAIISLLYSTGIRGGDLVKLKLNNIDWRNLKIHFVQGKTGTFIELPLDKKLCNIIADYILNGRPDTTCDILFIRNLAPHVGFKDGGSINNIIRRRLLNIGISRSPHDGLTMHGIRRNLGTEMIKKNLPVDTVAQILGHKTIRPTKQYISLDIEGLRKCALPLSSLGGKA